MDLYLRPLFVPLKQGGPACSAGKFDLLRLIYTASTTIRSYFIVCCLLPPFAASFLGLMAWPLRLQKARPMATLLAYDESPAVNGRSDVNFHHQMAHQHSFHCH